MAKSAAVRASNWFYIVAKQLGLTGDGLYEALKDQISRDALRDLVEATRKPQPRTIAKLERAINALRAQRIAEHALAANAPLTAFATYDQHSPPLVVKKPLSLEADVTAPDQRRRFDATYTGVYDLYRRESGPVAFIRDKLVMHRLFRNQFPVTLVSYVPDNHKPNGSNIRVYRGHSYINNTAVSSILGRPDPERRFDLCSLVLHRTQSPAPSTLSGILTSLTTSQGVPMATPVVLCRALPDGIDLDFPEFWQSHLDALISRHDFVASDLKARQKRLLGDKRDTMIAATAVDIEREFGSLCR